MNIRILTSYLLIIGTISAHCGDLCAAVVPTPFTQAHYIGQKKTPSLSLQDIEVMLAKNTPALTQKPELLQHAALCVYKSRIAAAAALPETDNLDDACDTSEAYSSDTEQSENQFSASTSPYPASPIRPVVQSGSAIPPASPCVASPCVASPCAASPRALSQTPITENNDDIYHDAQQEQNTDIEDAHEDADIYDDAQEEQDADFDDAHECVDETIGSNNAYFSTHGRAHYLHYIAQIAHNFNADKAQEIEFIVTTLFDNNIVLTLEDIERMMIDTFNDTTRAGSIMRVLLQKEFLYKLRFIKIEDKTYHQWHRILERAEDRYNMYPTENNALIVEKIKGKIALAPTSPRMILTPPHEHTPHAAPAERSLYNPIRYLKAAKELTFLVAAGTEHGLRNRGNTWIAKPFSWLAWATQ